ncbi:MAG: Eco57I restriction-modification methylase domain-containing protein, partial [Halobacteriaceae archaeon]
LTGQKSIDDFSGDMEWADETVERGSIALDWMDQEPLSIDLVDLIIMNPPFTRQESVGDFGDDYKDRLADRLDDYDENIHGLMSYFSYFVLLADKFLKPGGRVAAVIPSTILNKKSDKGIRDLLLENYHVEYIVSRSDEPNFSEDTDLREVLLVAKKGSQGPTTYVDIEGLDHDFSRLPQANEDLEAGDNMSLNGMTLQKVDVDTLNPNNLFGPVAINNNELLGVWTAVSESPKITSLDELDLGMIRGAQGGGYDARGYNPEMTLNSSDAYKLEDKDVWVVKEEVEDTIVAKHRHTGDEFEIPRENVVKNTRRFSGRRTNINEYAVVKRFNRFDDFESLTEQEDIPVEEWENRVRDRLSHFALIRRADMTAPGLSHTAFYSDEPSLWPNIMTLFTDADREESKILTLWFDSTFGWLQFLIDRIETRGGWMAWRGFITKKFRSLDPDKLSESERRTVLNTFDEVSSVESASIVQQLAACVDEDQLADDDIAYLRDAFNNIDDYLFEGFETRRSIDYMILNLLDIPQDEWNDMLESLYPGLLLELAGLKHMMD